MISTGLLFSKQLQKRRKNQTKRMVIMIERSIVTSQKVCIDQNTLKRTLL